MLNKETKTRIDRARDILVGQLPLPSDQIELITIAMIYKFMDDIDEQSRELGGKPTFFVGALRDLSWRKLISNTLSGEDRVTKFIQGIEAISDAKNQSIPDLFKSIFRNAFLKFRDGQVLKLFLDEINGFNYDHSEELGNAFEYLLDTMGSQGQNGQFRTPRNIIEFIVDVVDPQKDETILDPACGTAGFLISAYKHILAANTSSKAAEKDPHAGDQLKSAAREKLTRNITGYDITPLMCRLSRVNMYLHHFANPVIHEYDTLTNKNRWEDKFDVILANPPFMTPTGGISTHDKFRIDATRAEVLFADYILEHLNANGRAGFIVPEGIIFQNNDDYVSLRKWLINEAGLWAVVSLPANIFQPYSSVKTSVLFVDRALARERSDILLLKVENDGFSLNTNRTPIEENDLPNALKLLHVAKQHDFQTAVSNLKSTIQHRLAPRADFAKLDAYKAVSTAWDFCRKFHLRAERLKKTAAEACEAGDHDEAEKLKRALAKLPAEFTAATGLPKLPDTEAELRATFETQIKAGAAAYGDNPNESVNLTSDLCAALDAQRLFNLGFEKQTDAFVSSAKHELSKLGDCFDRVAEMCVPAELQSEVTYIGLENIESNTGRLVGEVECHSSNIKSAKVHFRSKDILYGRLRPNLNKVWLADRNGICSTDIIVLRPKNAEILTQLYSFLFRTDIFKKESLKGIAGAQLPRVSFEHLAKIEIPVPALEEQRSIVAELETHQRVLDGCTLVLNNHRPDFIVSPDWPEIQLGEIATFKNGIGYSNENRGKGIGVLSVANFKDNLVAPVNGLEEINPVGVVAEKDILHKGDIIFVRSNGNKRLVGRSMLIEIKEERLTHSAFTIRMRFHHKEIIPLFFALLLRTPAYRERLTGKGANISNLSQDILRGLLVPLPPLQIQNEIVANFQREQATLTALEALKATYEAKIDARLANVWGETTDQTENIVKSVP